MIGIVMYMFFCFDSYNRETLMPLDAESSVVTAKTGSGRPNAALSPLLTILSPNRAITSFALLVTRGSCANFRNRGRNFDTVFAASAAGLVLDEVSFDAPLVPSSRPIFIVLCMTGVL